MDSKGILEVALGTICMILLAIWVRSGYISSDITAGTDTYAVSPDEYTYQLIEEWNDREVEHYSGYTSR